MRRLAIHFIMAGLILPAFGAKPVPVAQLEAALETARSKPDADAAQLLSDFELTERLSSTVLSRLKTEAPGPKSAQELTILADRSAFLDLPAAEIPSRTVPDAAEQRRIMALVVTYVTQTTHRLPNFMASRETQSYEDRPAGDFGYTPLSWMSRSTASVIYRDGQEQVNAPGKGSKKAVQEHGLVSWGEFGPILSIVLLDAAKSKLEWSHWEQGSGQPQAVFRYEVPTTKSHYRVQYCCEFDGLVYLGQLDSLGSQLIHEFPGYHGEMAVDPATGAIQRITVEAELAPGGPLTSASLMVEYGPVEIGSKSFTCPVKSVALVGRHLSLDTIGAIPSAALQQGPIQTQLNHVTFADYHMFRADVRMLTPDEAGQAEEPPAGSQQSAAKDEPPAEPAPAPEPEPAIASAAAIAPAAAEPPPALKPAPVAPESAAPAGPDLPASTAPTIRTTTREVVVDVVVTKGDGDAVPGLAQQDFVIAENGKPQSINFFEEHSAGSVQAAAPPVMPPMPPGARTNVPPAAESDAVNVLLLDTLNTEQQDQVFVHRQIQDFLAGMRPGTRVAIFALGSKLRFVQGFTSDTSALLAALNAKKNGTKPDASFRGRSDIASDAADVSQLQTMQASPYAIESLQAAQADSRAQDFGARASMTFEALMYIGHYLAGVPGRKNLLWFASSFPVVIFPTPEQRDQMKRNPSLPGYMDKIRSTADLFTLSKIAVYPIAAEGMSTEHLAEADSAGPGAVGGVGHLGSQADATMSPYSGAAADRAATVYAMEQLAASTGGKAYFNTNDLNRAMRNAIDNGARYYTIGYTPAETKMDGSYRQIDVKLAKGKYKLAYRHGYNADDALATAAESANDPLVPLLAFGMPPAGGVLYGAQAVLASPQPATTAVRAGQNTALKGPLTRYAVDFIIRVQDVSLLSNSQGGRDGRILVGLKAYDGDGNAVNWLGDVEALEAGPKDYESLLKAGIPVHLEIDLPADSGLHLVSAVYDFGSGKGGTLEIPLPVSASSASGKAE